MISEPGGGKNICHICRGMGTSEADGRLMPSLAGDVDSGSRNWRTVNLKIIKQNKTAIAFHRCR